MNVSSDNQELRLRPAHRHLRLSIPRAILAMILREMSATYGRTPGGYAWVVLEPVLGIALLSALFSLGFRTPRLGSNFPIFYATGLLPFFMFNDISTKMAQAVNFSRSLLAYPRVTYMDALLARLILAVLTQLLVSFIIITGIRLIWDTRTVFEADKVLLAYLMVIVLAAGVGTMNAFLVTMFPVWQRIWSILTRPMVLISGVIILYETIPEPYASVIWFNPLIHAVSQARTGFYRGYDAPWISPVYVFGVGMVLMMLGLVFLRRYHRDMLER